MREYAYIVKPCTLTGDMNAWIHIFADTALEIGRVASSELCRDYSGKAAGLISQEAERALIWTLWSDPAQTRSRIVQP